MESSDYLRALGRRVWLLILLPVLAAGVTVGIIEGQPAQRESTAVVFAHPSSASSGSTVQYVTSFQAALTSNQVATEVSKTTGVPASDISGGLSSVPSAPNSVTLNVTYQGTQSRALVTRIPVLAARDALMLLIQPQQEVAASQVAAATKATSAAQAALAAYAKQTGVALPQQQYQMLESQLSQLKVLTVSNQVSGRSPGGAAAIDAAIGQTVGALNKLAPVVQQSQLLSDGQSRAVAQLQTAQTSYAAIQTEVSSLSAPGAITAGTITHVSRAKTLLKTAGPAAVVAFIIALGIVWLLERRRRSSLAAPATPVQGGSPVGAAATARER